MWIRDALARDIPGLRVFLYGYETTLKGSNSFESILDLSIAFINHLKASAWAKPTKKPLLLLAHSLGGIIAKEALTTLADNDQVTLSLVQGGVFFGVPSTGMETKHLLAVIKGQPNEDLVRDLSVKSEYLRMLDDRFSGICSLRNVKIFWAYEQRTSPTVVVRLHFQVVYRLLMLTERRNCQTVRCLDQVHRKSWLRWSPPHENSVVQIYRRPSRSRKITAIWSNLLRATTVMTSL
jgi:hypothetical protein